MHMQRTWAAFLLEFASQRVKQTQQLSQSGGSEQHGAQHNSIQQRAAQLAAFLQAHAWQSSLIKWA
jgi:hypothetical protein